MTVYASLFDLRVSQLPHSLIPQDIKFIDDEDGDQKIYQVSTDDDTDNNGYAVETTISSIA